MKKKAILISQILFFSTILILFSCSDNSPENNSVFFQNKDLKEGSRYWSGHVLKPDNEELATVGHTG